MKNLLAKINSYFAVSRRGKDILSSSDEKQEKLIRLGREQFQKLLDRGLSLPVMML